jgi:hypothetical protein
MASGGMARPDMGELGCVDLAGVRRIVAEQEIPQRHPGDGQDEQGREREAPVEPAQKRADEGPADGKRQRHGEQGVAQRGGPFVR